MIYTIYTFSMGSQWIAENFKTVQIMILGIFVIIGLLSVRSKQQKGSQFKVREADRPDANRMKGGPDLANAKLRPFNEPPKPPPLSLPGIRLHGEPHEILGVKENASEDEIMRSFKDLMKKYHPDRMHTVAPDQMKFYQDAASQINHAKEKMIEKIRRR